MATARKVLRTRRQIYRWKSGETRFQTNNVRPDRHENVVFDENAGRHSRPRLIPQREVENSTVAHDALPVVDGSHGRGGSGDFSPRFHEEIHTRHDTDDGHPGLNNHSGLLVPPDQNAGISVISRDEVDNAVTRVRVAPSDTGDISVIPDYPVSAMAPTREIAPGVDCVDYSPQDLVFDNFDTLVLLFSIGSFFVDVGSDIWVAILYFRGGHFWWFSLTVAFIVCPSVTMTIFSLSWYIKDHRMHKEHKDEQRATALQWTSRLFFLLLQLGPVLRYIDALRYGCRSRKITEENLKLKKTYFELMVYEDADSTLLRLFECFMEAAPQLVLQLYIMSREGTDESTFLMVLQVLSVSTSLVSLAWSLSAYHKALRFSLPWKRNMRIIGTGLQFLWRIFTIASRVIALAMFASCFQLWVFVVIAVHWAVMLAWIRLQRTKFCENSYEEFFFNLVCAVVYIFCYLNLIEGHTRLRYLLFYFIMYVENVGMIALWYVVTSAREQLWYHYPAIFMVVVGFFIGIVFMCIYYIWFHPNNYDPLDSKKSIRFCLSCRETLQSPLSMEVLNQTNFVNQKSGVDDKPTHQLPEHFQTDYSTNYSTFNTEQNHTLNSSYNTSYDRTVEESIDEVPFPCHDHANQNRTKQSRYEDRNYNYTAVSSHSSDQDTNIDPGEVISDPQYIKNPVMIHDIYNHENSHHKSIQQRNVPSDPLFKDRHYGGYIAKPITIRFQHRAQVYNKETNI